jgi:ribosome biogenesis SPOUT family RNA methylase Rps3
MKIELINKLFPYLSKYYNEDSILDQIEKREIISFSQCFIITEKIISAIIKINTEEIQYIDNPSLKLQRLAIKTTPDSFQYFSNKSSYEIKKLAIVESPSNLKYIKNPSQILCRLAVSTGAFAIQYIENPSIELQRLAVRKHQVMIQYIKNPDFEIIIDCIRRDKGIIKFINLLNLTAEQLETLKLLSI